MPTNHEHRVGIQPAAAIRVLLLISVILVYWPVTDNGFINFDDPDYITENPLVRSGLAPENIVRAFTSFHAGNWHPVTWVSHMLDVEIFGLNPGGHHLVSMLLHLTNTLILFGVLKKMTGDCFKSGMVAALFAFHPLHVESVAWAAERKDVLSTLFWMLSMAGYVGYVHRPTIIRWTAMAIFFALGLMAKPMLVTLPFVLLLLDVWPLGRFNIGGNGPATGKLPPGRLVLEKMPLFLLSGISCIITFWVQQKAGAVGPLSVYTLGHRVGNALTAYVTYIAKTLWPFDLAVFYPHPGLRPFWQAAGALFLLTAVSIFIIRNLKKHPYLFVGWSWYLGTLVPVIGLVQVGSQAMADRYTYIPLIGLFIMAAFGLPLLVKNRFPKKIPLALFSMVLVSVLMLMTRAQISHWRDDLSIYRHALSATTGNYLAHNNLGLALEEKGMPDDARGNYQKAIEIDPVYEDARLNLANLFEKQGRADEAIHHISEVLRFNPGSGQAHYNMGAISEKQGRIQEAIEHYRSALIRDPQIEQARNNLGNLMVDKGRYKEAIEHYNQALRINPYYENARYNMGVALEKLGRTDEAEDQYRQALKLSPGLSKAHTNLGGILLGQERIDAAVRHYTEAVYLEPGRGDVYFNLAVALEKQGQHEKAIFCYHETLRLDPGLNRARINLGSLMLRAGKPDAALIQFKEALQRDPEDMIARKNLEMLEKILK